MNERHSSSGEPKTRVLGALLSVYVVWGSTYLAIRYAVESIPPFLMSGVRFVIAGGILYVWARRRGSPAPSRSAWKAAVVTGVLMLFAGNGAVVWAEQLVPSSLVALIVAIVPLWMVLLDWFLPGGKRPTLAVSSGLILGLVGLALLIGPDALRGAGSGPSPTLIATFVPVAGSLFWAIGSIYSGRAARPASASLATGIQMLAGGAAFLLVALLTGEPARFHLSQVSTGAVLGFLYLLTFGSLVGFTAYIYLLGATTPAIAATYAYVNPVVAVLLGWAVAGETLTARTLTAAAVILGGVAMITFARSSSSARHTARSREAEHQREDRPEIQPARTRTWAGDALGTSSNDQPRSSRTRRRPSQENASS
jgi:drug/metabolite transporter (DMT)-like permease